MGIKNKISEKDMAEKFKIGESISQRIITVEAVEWKLRENSKETSTCTFNLVPPLTEGNSVSVFKSIERILEPFPGKFCYFVVDGYRLSPSGGESAEDIQLELSSLTAIAEALTDRVNPLVFKRNSRKMKDLFIAMISFFRRNSFLSDDVVAKFIVKQYDLYNAGNLPFPSLVRDLGNITVYSYLSRFINSQSFRRDKYAPNKERIDNLDCGLAILIFYSHIYNPDNENKLKFGYNELYVLEKYILSRDRNLLNQGPDPELIKSILKNLEISPDPFK